MRGGDAMSLIAPFPYFGGKRSVTNDVWARLRLAPSFGRVAIDPPHVCAVKDVLALLIPRRYCDEIMARLAFSFPSICASFVRVEFIKRLRYATQGAWLLVSSFKVTELVFHVFFCRIPPQVFEAIIARVSVGEMACVMARGWWLTDESEQYKAVDLACHDATINVERHIDVAIASRVQFHSSWCAETTSAPIIAALSFQAPDGAIASCKIAGESWDLSKIIFHSFALPIPIITVNWRMINA
jgi:hypothetical protein